MTVDHKKTTKTTKAHDPATIAVEVPSVAQAWEWAREANQKSGSTGLSALRARAFARALRAVPSIVTSTPDAEEEAEQLDLVIALADGQLQALALEE